MGQQTRDEMSELRAKDTEVRSREITAEDTSILEFIENTDGKRAPVNDPRTKEPIKFELTEEEVKAQEEALKQVAEGKKPLFVKNG